MSEKRTFVFRCLVTPEGDCEIVHGGEPLGWIHQVLTLGAVIHTVEMELPVPPMKPTFLGKLLGSKSNQSGTPA